MTALPRGSAAALARSLRLYHGRHADRAGMDALYGRFVKPGDLVFDIGAHVGDRISSFRRLGARVVALEPQPGPARVLRLLHGRDPLVTLVAAAAGDREGEIPLRINSANPTVSTASGDFVAAAAGAPGWEGQVWDATIAVRCVTLDGLVREHGRPTFVKIDVEGFEDRVLQGLTAPVPALSFEFTTIARAVADRCLARVSSLGRYRFDLSLGESRAFALGRWVDAAAMSDYLQSLPHEANSGDVYAVLA
jgi:FkbM family methyltransferase